MGILVITVSYVSAYQPFPSNPPAGQVPTPINVGTNDQTKTGGIYSQKSFIAGSGITQPGSDSFILAKAFAGSADGFLGRMLVSGTTSKMQIGSGANTLPTPLVPTGNTTPLTIDLTGRSGNLSYDAIDIISGNRCKDTSTIRVNTAAIRFADGPNVTNDNVDLIAQQLRLSGGNPGEMRVLIATNDRGDAVWGTMSIVNGQVRLIYNDSPVTSGQCESNPPIEHVYQWDIGEWGECVNNQQIRDVVCLDENGDLADDSLCPQPKPATTQSCFPATAQIEVLDCATPPIGVAEPDDCVNVFGANTNPLVPYYVLFEETRYLGGPGRGCYLVDASEGYDLPPDTIVHSTAPFSCRGGAVYSPTYETQPQSTTPGRYIKFTIKQYP